MLENGMQRSGTNQLSLGVLKWVPQVWRFSGPGFGKNAHRRTISPRAKSRTWLCERCCPDQVWKTARPGAPTRAEIFRPYQVNAELMRCAKENAIFLHCLPAHRGDEV